MGRDSTFNSIEWIPSLSPPWEGGLAYTSFNSIEWIPSSDPDDIVEVLFNLSIPLNGFGANWRRLAADIAGRLLSIPLNGFNLCNSNS